VQEDAAETDDADDAEREDEELLADLVHAVRWRKLAASALTMEEKIAGGDGPGMLCVVSVISVQAKAFDAAHV
jgi:hypothetical protein